MGLTPLTLALLYALTVVLSGQKFVICSVNSFVVSSWPAKEHQGRDRRYNTSHIPPLANGINSLPYNPVSSNETVHREYRAGGFRVDVYNTWRGMWWERRGLEKQSTHSFPEASAGSEKSWC